MVPPLDSDRDPVHEARFRLFGSGGRGSRRSIVLSPAMLERSADAGPWTLAVRDDGTLDPIPPLESCRMSWGAARCRPHRRLVYALAVPGDFQRRRIPMAGHLLEDGRTGGRNSRRSSTVLRTIYGWAIAYRFPESTGPALVDPHEDVPELPAFYESPVELIDRIIHLEARDIATRPIALLVRPSDFLQDERGGRINRYFPTPVPPGPRSPD